MKVKQNIKKLVSKGLFEQAYGLIADYSIEDKWEIIRNELYRVDPAQIYSFLRYLVAKDAISAEWEYYCFVYLVYCDPFFDDSMRLAAWHLRKAIELDCKNIEYMKQVISVFYTYNDCYFSDEEFFLIAKEVIRHDPTNQLAQTVIDSLSKKIGNKSQNL